MLKPRVTHASPATLLALSLPFLAAASYSAHASAPAATTQQTAASTRHTSGGAFQTAGLMTTVAFGPNGETTVKTMAIDIRRYVESGGSVIAQMAMPAGVLAVPRNVAAMGACAPRDLSIDCGNTTQPGTDPTNPGGLPPNINPDANGPGAPAPDIPDPPMTDTLSCPVGITTLVQYYDAGQWQQTTAYNRPVYDAGSGCSNGPWGEPVVNQAPVDD